MVINLISSHQRQRVHQFRHRVKQQTRTPVALSTLSVFPIDTDDRGFSFDAPPVSERPQASTRLPSVLVLKGSLRFSKVWFWFFVQYPYYGPSASLGCQKGRSQRLLMRLPMLLLWVLLSACNTCCQLPLLLRINSSSSAILSPSMTNKSNIFSNCIYGNK